MMDSSDEMNNNHGVHEGFIRDIFEDETQSEVSFSKHRPTITKVKTSDCVSDEDSMHLDLEECGLNVESPLSLECTILDYISVDENHSVSNIFNETGKALIVPECTEGQNVVHSSTPLFQNIAKEQNERDTQIKKESLVDNSDVLIREIKEADRNISRIKLDQRPGIMSKNSPNLIKISVSDQRRSNRNVASPNKLCSQIDDENRNDMRQPDKKNKNYRSSSVLKKVVLQSERMCLFCWTPQERSSSKAYVLHLLEECMKIRYDKGRRRNVIRFILESIARILNLVQKNKNVHSSVFENIENSNTKALLEHDMGQTSILVPMAPQWYECPVCLEPFGSPENCYHHMFIKCIYTEKNEEDGIGLMCTLEEIFTKNVDLLSAQCQLHKLIVCKYCNAILPDLKSLKEHYREEISQPICGYTCRICNFKTSSSQSLAQHINKKHVDCSCREKEIREPCTNIHECPLCENEIRPCEMIGHLEHCQPLVSEPMQECWITTCTICRFKPKFLVIDLENHLINKHKAWATRKPLKNRPQKLNLINTINCFKDLLSFSDLRTIEELIQK